jgi:hypothetical protein
MRSLLPAAFILTTALCTTSQADRPHQPVFKNAIWDDGRAEVSIYDALIPHYGKLHPSKVSMIYVKEPFNTQSLVKSDQPTGPDISPAIKFNYQISTRTGSYTYEQMLSAFWTVADRSLRKWTLSHHEACGNTFKMGIPEKKNIGLTYHTYWDGEGSGKILIPKPKEEQAWFYEELPYRLREVTATRSRDSIPIQLFTPVIHSKLGRPVFRAATIVWKDDLPNTVFEVQHHGGTDTLVFDRKFPHVLREWKQAGGAILKLIETQRLAYWEKHQPTDPPLIPGK